MGRTFWKTVLLTSLGAILLFVFVFYGLKTVEPAKASTVSYKMAEKINGECYDCHAKKTPGVADEYAHSKHVTRGVKCIDCHTPKKGSKTIDHYGSVIVAKPTPGNCATCHKTESEEFAASNHGARSWYAITGAKGFTQEQLKKFHLLDEKGNPKNGGKPNAVAVYEGKEAMTLGCTKCHAIGEIRDDGSVGNCNTCHRGHSYSLEQVRKPESCAQCHLGPDHPQKEIYDESPHGAIYNATGDKWNWEAAPGTLTVKDMPAPTCATCHMSGFGGVPGTHNVSERLTWNLTPDIATKRENGEAGRQKMNSICLNCHAQNSITQHFKDADELVEMVNANVLSGKTIVKDLENKGLKSTKPFSSSIDFKYFELWHHEGRRARFGGMMGGPDFVQWHGIYEQKKDLVELLEMADNLKNNTAK